MDQGGFFMCDILSMKTLEDMKAGYATLGVAGYTLPVPFRVRGQTVECRVPTWSGVGDLLEITRQVTRQVTLVVVQNSENGLRWVFLRGLGVKVTINSGGIVDIQPDSDEALEQELSERIVAAQSLLVDINTGATVSSKAFLKAVEEALSP
jgi:hypothetical protein